ncbi:unnamed protein product [Mytilus coruscus]|uniref:Uncharacterized protein n=1 Tax=Mytilus coruscus TaxID=42192 RepID=A0A6J8AUI4_MYTCO|nr:unnamed protein product [Mytilus coruscus]
MFDITLMTTLLTNLTNLDHYNEMPLVTDTTTAADLGRIKFYRNHIAHNIDGKMDNSLFNTSWDDIIQAVGRLGGQIMIDECKELRTKMLDQSTIPWNIRGKGKLLKAYYDDIGKHIMDQRVQMSHVLEEWKTIDSNFVETRAAKHILKRLQENNCVTITASSGVGKTATLRHAVLQMKDEGYNVLLITNPHDIVKFYNPNEKTLFVMDNFCGTYSINMFDLNSFESVLERIKVLIQNKVTKIIVACRLQVYQDDKLESLSIFRTCVCNLQSEDLCLTQTEKTSIAERYLDTKASEVIQFCDMYDCFPLLCTLYNENPDRNISDFFINPFSVYEAEIDKLNKRGHFGKYCALALCVILNNRLVEDFFTGEVNILLKIILENTCKACRLDRGTSRLILLDELRSLEHTFIKKEQDVYKTIHDKIFDFLVYYFGQKIIQCLIKNADSEVIMQRFLLEKQDDMNQFITVVPFKYHQIYIQRIIDDWYKGRVQCVFNNINMKTTSFRQRFLCCIKSFDITPQRQLAMTCDFNCKDTVLLQCSQYNDIQLIQWCIYHGVDVNQSNSYGLSPLCGSSQEGGIEVVKLLLHNKANINQCANNGASPLHIACLRNHIEILKILLESKADINKCRDDGTSPLSIACYMNHIDIVRLLLENKAEINKCTYNGTSPLCNACGANNIEIAKLLLENKADINKNTGNGPYPLYMASQYNNIEIVKLLLNNKADTNKCVDGVSSPLYIACQNNHKEVVQLLLDNNADMDRITDDEHLSPFYIACFRNHTEIVKLLLDNKVDLNKCVRDGVSPLLASCYNNHIETVRILLNNNANINKCRDNGTSPLSTACEMNHIGIVNILLKNKADINKDQNNGATPLFIACQHDNKEIVQVLLDKSADIDKCRDDGASPLSIACEMNHIDIVKILLSNKADINKDRNGGASPLCVACYFSNKEIVQLLLDNKADINKCTKNGAYPLYIACQNKHIEVVKLLLDSKVDINVCKRIQTSRSHYARP